MRSPALALVFPFLAAACGASSTTDSGQSAPGDQGPSSAAGAAGAPGAGGAPSSGAGGGAGAGPCLPCVVNEDCGSGRCAQLAGETYCAPLCDQGACAAGLSCVAASDVGGAQVKVCAPVADACGSTGMGEGGAGDVGGSAGSGSGGADPGGPPTGQVGPSGGTLDKLMFAIVGDTRPPAKNDTAGYPSAVIGAIWKKVQASGAPFAVTTGDYIFAGTTGNAADDQIDLYLAARAAFPGTVFPALGNHECTGAVTSNCGPGNVDGETVGYKAFVSKMLGPIAQAKPYYAVHVDGGAQGWTSKFVVVAANAWDSAQAAWLAEELAKPTTYTFVVRHEASYANTAPGVKPSDAIIAAHPYTLKLVGHTHTFQYLPKDRTVVCGNGGAPLTGSVNYGYVIAHQRPDGAIAFDEHDYASGAVVTSFAVKADGSPAP